MRIRVRILMFVSVCVEYDRIRTHLDTGLYPVNLVSSRIHLVFEDTSILFRILSVFQMLRDTDSAQFVFAVRILVVFFRLLDTRRIQLEYNENTEGYD